MSYLGRPGPARLLWGLGCRPRSARRSLGTPALATDRAVVPRNLLGTPALATDRAVTQVFGAGCAGWPPPICRLDPAWTFTPAIAEVNAYGGCKRIRVSGRGVGCGRVVRGRPPGASSQLRSWRASRYSRCALVSGHSPASIEYITVSRTVPSRRGAWWRRTPSLCAPRRSIARCEAKL